MLAVHLGNQAREVVADLVVGIGEADDDPLEGQVLVVGHGQLAGAPVAWRTRSTAPMGSRPVTAIGPSDP